MSRLDVLKLLERDDKIALGGGKMVIWAPEFPLFADHLGFWDHACFLEYPVEPIFTITLLDEGQRELPVKMVSRRWTPAVLTQTYDLGQGLTVIEEKCLHPEDVLISRLTISNHTDEPRRLQAVAWTAQMASEVPQMAGTSSDVIAVAHEPQMRAGTIAWRKEVYDAQGERLEVIWMRIGADQAPQSWSVTVSEVPAELITRGVNYPYWRLTPMYERITVQGLPIEFKPTGGPQNLRGRELIFLAQEFPLEVRAGGEAMLTVGCAIAPSASEASFALEAALSDDPIEVSRVNWEEFFASVPYFTCSDPYLEKYYWYRWFGLRLNAIDTGGAFKLPYPCVYEGINKGWFRHQITYSSQVLAYDLRWWAGADHAKGALLNFIANQREDGSFPGGIITSARLENRGFYHGNWGWMVRQLHRLTGDEEFIAEVYEPLVHYVEYFQRERDREGSHLYDVIDQSETGQEYMSRYLFADPEADHWGRFRLKGVDATVYIYELYRNLAWMAKRLGRLEEAVHWAEEAQLTKEAVLSQMWDSKMEMFVDVLPFTGQRSSVKAVTCFYPFLTDIAGPEHLGAIHKHMLNPREFWTEYPMPSSSLDDPQFSAEGEWKGRRHNCPWNGRSWLMTNSHAMEALARAAQRLDPDLKGQAVELINRCIRMLFLDGDLARPTSYEYYNPLNGKAPFFRGTDDYMHSWIVDLIIRYVVGLQVEDEGRIIIDPLPFNLDHFTLENAQVRGKRVKITWCSEGPQAGLRAYVDGQLVAHSTALERLEFQL